MAGIKSKLTEWRSLPAATAVLRQWNQDSAFAADIDSGVQVTIVGSIRAGVDAPQSWLPLATPRRCRVQADLQMLQSGTQTLHVHQIPEAPVSFSTKVSAAAVGSIPIQLWATSGIVAIYR